MSKTANSRCKSSNAPSTKVDETAQRAANSPPLEILCDESEQLNPAILLAEELMRRDITQSFDFDDTDRIRATLEYSEREIQTVENQLNAFVKTPGSPSRFIPLGF